jgi:predicted metal-dependent enzyme (double-stranded beta helix superfamily)
MVESNPQIDDLIQRINQAVTAETPAEIGQLVKDALCDVMGQGPFLPTSYLEPVEGHYARRLLHKDPQDRYSMVVMVWDGAQRTPLHDHAGQWCVECVCQGNIGVMSYELKSQNGDLCQFELQEEAQAGVGEAGMLIPPFEHHILENPHGQVAVTLHVYSQELTWCNAFTHVEGNTYRQERKELGYDN